MRQRRTRRLGSLAVLVGVLFSCGQEPQAVAPALIVDAEPTKAKHWADESPAAPARFVLQRVGQEDILIDAATLSGIQQIADPRGRLQGWELGEVLKAVGVRESVRVSVVVPEVNAHASRPPGVYLLPDVHDQQYLTVMKFSGNGSLRVQVWDDKKPEAEPPLVYRGPFALSLEPISGAANPGTTP